MSLSDWKSLAGDRLRSARSAALPAMLAAALASALAACTVQPVYMTIASGPNVGADLSAIAIGDVSDRVGQELRNDLVFGFTGGSPPAASPRYTLSIQVATTELRLGFERDDTAPAYLVEVRVTYELVEIGSNRTILRSVNRGMASYDRSNQSFANVRARIDAENRAAQVAADDIQLRIAAALARKS